MDSMFTHFHQGLDGHWASIRPGLLKNILGVKVHMAKLSPICILTATITPAAELPPGPQKYHQFQNFPEIPKEMPIKNPVSGKIPIIIPIHKNVNCYKTVGAVKDIFIQQESKRISTETPQDKFWRK